jgi:hypothetical protein
LEELRALVAFRGVIEVKRSVFEVEIFRKAFIELPLGMSKVQ